LGQGFDNEYPREDRIAREMALEEDFARRNILDPYCFLAWLQVNDLIYQEERPTMWDDLLDFSGT
jgi:hypothetical protein